MALILPVLLLLILGTIDFAQVMYAYCTVSEAARAGARYAIVHGSTAPTPVGPTANDATVAGVVKNYSPALNPQNLTITSSWPDGTNTATSPVSVTVSYSCPLSIGHLIGLGPITVSGTTTMTIAH
jgi:Flp pilus assembly protein TadG